MMKSNIQFITTKQAAELWGISQRRVGILCSQNRIEGAVLMGKTWLIPSDTQKPKDERFKEKKEYAKDRK